MNPMNIEGGLQALAAVQQLFPGAVLAGGYLRDKFFGRSPKDIDIFIPNDPELITLAASSIPGASRVTALGQGAEYMSAG